MANRYRPISGLQQTTKRNSIFVFYIEMLQIVSNKYLKFLSRQGFFQLYPIHTKEKDSSIRSHEKINEVPTSSATGRHTRHRMGLESIRADRKRRSGIRLSGCSLRSCGPIAAEGLAHAPSETFRRTRCHGTAPKRRVLPRPITSPMGLGPKAPIRGGQRRPGRACFACQTDGRHCIDREVPIDGGARFVSSAIEIAKSCAVPTSQIGGERTFHENSDHQSACCQLR